MVGSSHPSAHAHTPTIAFDASSTGAAIRGAGKLDEIDLCQLRFTAPKEAEDRGDSKVCLAKAFLLPGKGSLKVRLDGASVVRVTHSRADTHTVAVSIPGFDSMSELSRFLLSLDARVLEVAQANTNAWFLHKMNADLVEEYYRGCSSAVPGAGVVGRFVIDGAGDLIPRPLSTAALTLQLVGLQFRPQYFTCVWRLIEAAQWHAPPPPPPAPAKKKKKVVSFLRDGPEDDEEEEDEAESDDDDSSGPSMEQRAEIRQELMARLLKLQSHEQDRMDSLLDMIRTLDRSSLHDLEVMGKIDHMLSDLA